MKPVWNSIVMHHTFKVGIPDDPGFLNWNSIVHHHVAILGYDDVGYNFGIEYVGNHIVICPGRSTLREGAHCRNSGMNWHALGVAVIGNFDHYPPDDNIYQNAALVCHFLMLKYPTITIDRIFPHSKFSNKTCPGKMYDMDKLKYLIKKL